MPQFHTPNPPSRARLQAGVGYVPQQPISPTSPIPFDGSTGDLPIPATDYEAIAAALVSFGTGAPGGVPDFDGQLYFDDTLATYAGYVGRAGVWNQFS